MSLTTDPNDPRLNRGQDESQPHPQNEVYLVLSEEERSKGFVRPLRRSYIHVGPPGPKYALRELREDEQHHKDSGYVKYEEDPKDGTHGSALGRLWTQAQLDGVGKGCRVLTHMGLALCETYARNPKFYGVTYCCGCQRHLPVAEFVWDEDGQRVGS